MDAIKPQFKTMLESIGNTPLIRLELPVRPTILAKLEYLNPSGSLKDRAALYMVEEAERLGKLKPGGTIIEATSGNQGISLAMIGAIKGYRVIITVPDRTTLEKIAVLRAYGAEVHVCPNTASHDDPRGYHARAEQLLHEIPGAFMPNQYYSPSNPMGHYHSTGPEIWQQTAGTLTHFIAGTGTCGTISGVGRYLKEKNPSIKIIGVDAANSLYSSPQPKEYTVEGLGIDVISEAFDQSVVDHIIPITDEDAFNSTRRVAKENGLLVGISSGAVLHVAMKYAQQLSENDIVVVMLADSGRAYLSKVFMTQQTESTPVKHGVKGVHERIV
ncbi:cysteine synthase family protein [Candidatus Dependentiae bacterium]|nr:cysteine synthase family protein [Candidatus Dependentiae bacterium]